jgi:anti-sigma regulatory factor (Ser/Thr protein kinase)
MTDMSGRRGAVSASFGLGGAAAIGRGSGTDPASDGTGALWAVVGGGALTTAQSQARAPLPPSSPFEVTDQRTLTDRLRGPYLQMIARPGAVPCARHHARQLLWEWGLKELADPVELVVSEIITNAVRALGGLDERHRNEADGMPLVRLWLAAEQTSVLVLVWDGSPLQPERQEPEAEAESGRGLLLVETLSVGWGSFVPDGGRGKVVWALCQV